MLKRTGNYARAARYALLALVVVAAEITLGIRLTTASVLRTFAFLLPALGLTSTCLAGLLTLAVIAIPVVMLLSQRQLRRAVAQGGQQLLLASAQPDRSLALRDGETITLMRRRLRIGTLRDIGVAAQFLILSLQLGIPIVLIAPLFLVNPLDIGVLAYLVLLCSIIVLAGLWMVWTIKDQWLRITCDDRGVVVERPLSSRRFIPWNDILLFLRTRDNKSAALEGSYVLWGRDHFVEFDIGGPSTSVEANEKPWKVENSYRYEGGFDTYARNAGRLLATIVDRSYVSLHVLPARPASGRRVNRPISVAAWDLAQVLEAPDAPLPLQPPAEAIEAARHITGRLTLACRLTTPSFFAQLIIGFIGMLALSGAIGTFLHMPDLMLAPLLSGDPFTLLTYLLLIPMLLAYAFAFAWMLQRRKRPALKADDQCLTMMASHSVRIRWRDMRAWGVVPGAPGRPTTLMVFSSDQVVRWREPDDAVLGGRRVHGDRRAAFREHAQELHALIAARTGLTLRELHLNDESGRALS